MPEGHTIHRLARDHQRDFARRTLQVSSPQGRFAAGARRLNGRRLERVDAYGKHLFYWWDMGRALHVHLGLYGRFRHHHPPVPAPQGQVRLRVMQERKAFDLIGPNVCELITPDSVKEITSRLGPDPLRRDADPDAAWRRISQSRAAIGTLLLDQSVIAGVGNVYRAESLHAVGLHPEQPGGSLRQDDFQQLWHTLGQMLAIGVKFNRIITTDLQLVRSSPRKPPDGERLRIYKCERCGDCGRAVSSWLLGGRTIYACLRCQKRRPK